MGLRIHRAMGYGLVVPTSEFNEKYLPLLHQLSDTYDAEDRSAVEEYVAFLRTKYENVRNTSIDYVYARSLDKLSKNVRQLSLLNIFNVLPSVEINTARVLGEYTVLIVTLPFQHEDWFRVDNGMDYVDHLYKYDEPKNVLTFLKKPLYPFNFSIMNKTTGALLPVSSSQQVLINLHSTNQNGEYDEILDSISMTDYGMPFSEVLEKYTPASVPVEVQDLMEWVGLTEPGVNVTHKFQPAIADWWE